MEDIESITARIEEVWGLAPGAVNEDAIASFFNAVMVEIADLGAVLPQVTLGREGGPQAKWVGQWRELIWECRGTREHFAVSREVGSGGGDICSIPDNAPPEAVARKLIGYMPEDVQTESAVRAHLAAKGVTLWGDWDISRPEGMEAAVKWLAGEIDDVGRMAWTMSSDDWWLAVD